VSGDGAPLRDDESKSLDPVLSASGALAGPPVPGEGALLPDVDDVDPEDEPESLVPVLVVVVVVSTAFSKSSTLVLS
jgi:hypothetical protein